MDEQTLREYYDALVRIDELSLQLGRILSMMRMGWDEENGERSDCLKPINDIARRIGEAVPVSIRATRPMIQHDVAQWSDCPIRLV